MSELEVGQSKAALIAKAVPAVVAPRDLIVAEVVEFSNQGVKALAVAQHAEVTDHVSAGQAADVLRAVNQQLKKLGTAKTRRAAPFVAAATAIRDLYTAASVNLTKAQNILTAKAAEWRKAEERRTTEEANERRIRRADAARQLAETQAALGDVDGANRIIEEAAALPDAPEKVEAVGTYGAKLSTRTRNVGQVTDRRKFLAAVANSQDPFLVNILTAIEIPQGKLNALAIAVNDGKTLPPPGFLADHETKDVVL